MTLEILVVEDDPVVQYLHKSVLKKCSLPEQKYFYNGKLALEYILENRNKDLLYLILLDINMPIMNGWEFLEELSKHTISPQVKVVMVTSSIDGFDKERAGKYKHVFQFMEKPLIEESVSSLRNDADLASYLN